MKKCRLCWSFWHADSIGGVRKGQAIVDVGMLVLNLVVIFFVGDENWFFRKNHLSVLAAALNACVLAHWVGKESGAKTAALMLGCDYVWPWCATLTEDRL